MTFFERNHTSKIQNVYQNTSKCISVDIKREDEIHPYVSGNKFRKLKYNLEFIKSTNYDTLLTYGGAFSNHIAASAAAAKICGIKSIGIIRGEEIEKKFVENPEHNPTLAYAVSQGMKLYFVNRSEYANKDSQEELRKLKNKFGEFYRIPEGGTNALAVKGCEEILTSKDHFYDIIVCCVGTGGTISGIINSSEANQKILGFSALKNHQHYEISQYANKNNWDIIEENYFGGYAKSTNELVEFINSFYKSTSIKLDPVYTGKMMFRLYKMIEENQITENTKVLAIHSGGLQGVNAYNNLLKSRNRPLIVFQ